MLSRVAESIYWLNRYIERAENVARFIDVNLHLTIGKNDQLGEQWRPLISTTGDDEEFNEKYDGVVTRENVLAFLLFDDTYSNSVVSCVSLARENARRVRQVLPLVVWEQLNLFYLMVRAAARERNFAQVQDFCEKVRLTSHLLAGAEDATSTKGETWSFGRLARMSERADKTSRIVDVQYFLLLPDEQGVGSPLDVLRWTALLQSTNALMMYRRQHGRIVPTRVAEFLILDPYFSRSIYHCVLAAKEALSNIVGPTLDSSPPGRTMQVMNNGQTQSLGDLLGVDRGIGSDAAISQLEMAMREATIEQIVTRGIHEYIDDFQTQLNHVGKAVCDEFFAWEEMGDNAENTSTQ